MLNTHAVRRGTVRCMASRKALRAPASRPFSASSSSNTSGRRTSARASRMRRRCPYDKTAKLARGQASQADTCEHCLDPAVAARHVSRLQREIGVVEPGLHDLRHVECRFVTLVTVLPLGTEIRDACAGIDRLRVHFAIAQVIATLFDIARCRPQVATQQFQQHRLAGAVRSFAAASAHRHASRR